MGVWRVVGMRRIVNVGGFGIGCGWVGEWFVADCGVIFGWAGGVWSGSGGWFVGGLVMGRCFYGLWIGISGVFGRFMNGCIVGCRVVYGGMFRGWIMGYEVSWVDFLLCKLKRDSLRVERGYISLKRLGIRAVINVYFSMWCSISW